MTLIGITDEDFQHLITEAYKQGYHDCQREKLESEWLVGRDAIIGFLSQGRTGRMSVRSFYEHRRQGHFGDAVVGSGESVSARRDDLRAAWGRYQQTKFQTL